MSLQDKFDVVFSDFLAGEFTREGYRDAVQSLYEGLPGHYRAFVDSRLGKRRDLRTVGEFALHLYDTTARERLLVAEWVKLFPGVSVTDHGVANDGRLVVDPHGGSRRADYMLTSSKGNFPLELKFGPSVRHVTYKVADLENYAQVPDLHVITFIWPEGTEWSGTLPPGVLWFSMLRPHLLRVLERGHRGTFSGFGGKPTVRIYDRDFGRFFKIRGWKTSKKFARRDTAHVNAP